MRNINKIFPEPVKSLILQLFVYSIYFLEN